MVKKIKLVDKPELDKFMTKKKKAYATHKKGAEKYGVEIWTFRKWAKDAGAILKWKDLFIVDLEILDGYLQREQVKTPKRRKRNGQREKSDR